MLNVGRECSIEQFADIVNQPVRETETASLLGVSVSTSLSAGVRWEPPQSHLRNLETPLLRIDISRSDSR